MSERHYLEMVIHLREGPGSPGGGDVAPGGLLEINGRWDVGVAT